MKLTLTKEQMLNQWRRRRYAEPERLDCTVVRTDGEEFDSHLIDEMRAWYLDLLDGADPRYVCPSDVTDRVRLTYLPLDGITLIKVLPVNDVRSVVSVTYSGWLAPEQVKAESTLQQVRFRSANPYWNRPAVAPMGRAEIVVGGADGELTQVMAILDPGPEQYVFDDSALNLIKPL